MGDSQVIFPESPNDKRARQNAWKIWNRKWSQHGNTAGGVTYGDYANDPYYAPIYKTSTANQIPPQPKAIDQFLDMLAKGQVANVTITEVKVSQEFAAQLMAEVSAGSMTKEPLIGSTMEGYEFTLFGVKVVVGKATDPVAGTY